MSLASGTQNAFKMILIFGLGCVMILAVLTFSTDYSGTQPLKPPPSRIRSGIASNNALNKNKATQPSVDVKNQTNNISPNTSTSVVTSPNSTASNTSQDKAIKQDPSTAALSVKEEPKPLKTCPTSKDIPSEKITPRKDTTTLEKVNAEIFGQLVQSALDATDVANKTLPSIMVKRRSIKEAASYIDQTISEMNVAVEIDDYRLIPGGHWTPLSCRPRWKVAIVVPFRNRFQHLPIFLRHIVPLLKRQKLEFSIFISEQRNDLRFNRAMLMNIGFVEALNFTNYDCVVFHDIDHLAINVKNYYGCDEMPRHFISGEAIWQWKLVYAALFGGVTGVTTAQFQAINGLSNVYWGWGGEDDDFAKRVAAKGFKRSRPEGEIGYYDSIVHQKKKSSPPNNARFCLLGSANQRMTTDGISSLVYEPPVIELHPLYTNISVNIQRLPWNPHWKKCSE